MLQEFCRNKALTVRFRKSCLTAWTSVLLLGIILNTWSLQKQWIAIILKYALAQESKYRNKTEFFDW